MVVDGMEIDIVETKNIMYRTTVQSEVITKIETVKTTFPDGTIVFSENHYWYNFMTGILDHIDTVIRGK